VTLIEALRHPDAFGSVRRFRDLSSWSAWLVALQALYGLSMTDKELATFTACTGRTEAPTEEASEAVFIVGRRGGKSQVAALIAVYTALFRDWSTHLSAGERAHCVLVGQNMRAVRVLLGYVRGILNSVPAFAAEVEAERVDEIDLRNQTTISIWPCTFRATRGLTLAAAVCDEVDFWFQESLNAAEEVIGALRPALATLPQTKLIAISSPYTPTGWLFDFHQAHWAQPGPCLVWKAPSIVMNPTLDQAKIAAAMVEDPLRGSSEWESEWRSGASAAFNPDDIDACIRSSPLELPPELEGVRR